jgi:4-aminobutyrate aminotransferase-like enzyme
VKYLANFCKKNNIILAFDEMQSGFSRTGKNFGFMHYGVKPDLICCGKGMGGGLPISGVLGKKKLMDLPGTGSMSSTHSANPLVCEAGNAVLDEIKIKNLNYEVYRKGKILSKVLIRIKKK